MAATTFTLDDLPDVTFTVARGVDENQPGNWITITATRPDEPTEDDPDPAPITVCELGFAGP
ncbi:hypothetical protein [Gordonia sp. N1V]|uniref:hypothetical protein n=1 Tax=Gordonia sp. N1V TaxID=3034163 RepID=UPI0023E35175|nr:hypothetical protein [Gordonia sp. N1V]MDF3280499.1 hypothetical protein [Gordonia sp. N1V]